jgi:cation transport protein ChaC
MTITREQLTPEWIAAVTAEIREKGLFEPLTPEERDASLKEALASAPPGEDVWLFGYGSLIWNPIVHYCERRVGLLYGYHRRYCFWVGLGRGTPEQPGLMLGLDRGGSCNGVAFRISAEKAEDELRLIWLREMLSGVYLPRWVTLHSPEGKYRAITFVVNREHSRYCGILPPETAAGHLASAEGWLGSCREYLENTIAHLAEFGISDRYLNHLDRLVKARGG